MLDTGSEPKPVAPETPRRRPGNLLSRDLAEAKIA
jgi:hypothetical protein